MKRIRKGSEPPELVAWRAALRPRGAVPDWESFGDPARGATRTGLAADQFQLCCYCTAAIDRGDYHIEHWKPREHYRDLTYIWSNMLASCESYRNENIEGEIVETQRHCGAAKDNWFEDGVTVDPQHREVETWFRYPLSGRLAASKTLSTAHFNNVETTISKLNLNAPSLVTRRRKLLARAAQDAASMSRDNWRARYLDPRGQAYQEFWPALNYNYVKHWAARF